MQKIILAVFLLLAVLSSGCISQTVSEPEPVVNYSSPVGNWVSATGSDGFYLGMILDANGVGVYGYYSDTESHELSTEWYEYNGKYYVFNATSNAGDVFILSDDGKSLTSESGDVLYRE